MVDVLRIAKSVTMDFEKAQAKKGWPQGYWTCDNDSYVKAIIAIRYLYEIELKVQLTALKETACENDFKKYYLSDMVRALFAGEYRFALRFTYQKSYCLSKYDSINYDRFVSEISIQIFHAIYGSPVDVFTIPLQKLSVEETMYSRDGNKNSDYNIHKGLDAINLYTDVLNESRRWPTYYWRDINDPLYISKILTEFLVDVLLEIDETKLKQVHQIHFSKYRLLGMIKYLFDGNYRLALRHVYGDRYPISSDEEIQYEKCIKTLISSNSDLVPESRAKVKSSFNLAKYYELQSKDYYETKSFMAHIIDLNKHCDDENPIAATKRSIQCLYQAPPPVHLAVEGYSDSVLVSRDHLVEAVQEIVDEQFGGSRFFKVNYSKDSSSITIEI